MTFITEKMRTLMNRVRRRRRNVADVHIRLVYCCVCGGTEGLSQHHEPPLTRGGNITITICEGCKRIRHGRGKEKAEIIEKIRAEIKRRVGFV